eukprot:351297-Chlamydomonas_euryale.AAC.3
MEPVGASQIPMEPVGASQIPMEPVGASQIPMEPVGASQIPMEQRVELRPARPAFPRHTLPPLLGCPVSDQFSLARQLKKVPKSGATPGAFLMAPPDCRAGHPRKIIRISVTLFSVVTCGRLLQLTLQKTLLTSNQKPASASDPYPFAMRAPSTEGCVYKPSTPARTFHIVHVWSQDCGACPFEPLSMCTSTFRSRARKWGKHMCDIHPFFTYCSAWGWHIYQYTHIHTHVHEHLLPPRHLQGRRVDAAEALRLGLAEHAVTEGSALEKRRAEASNEAPGGMPVERVPRRQPCALALCCACSEWEVHREHPQALQLANAISWATALTSLTSSLHTSQHPPTLLPAARRRCSWPRPSAEAPRCLFAWPRKQSTRCASSGVGRRRVFLCGGAPLATLKGDRRLGHCLQDVQKPPDRPCYPRHVPLFLHESLALGSVFRSGNIRRLAKMLPPLEPSSYCPSFCRAVHPRNMVYVVDDCMTLSELGLSRSATHLDRLTVTNTHA